MGSLVGCFAATALQVFGMIPETFRGRNMILQSKATSIPYSYDETHQNHYGWALEDGRKFLFEYRYAPQSLTEDDDSFPSFNTPEEAAKYWGFPNPSDNLIEIDKKRYIRINDAIHLNGNKVYLDNSIDNDMFKHIASSSNGRTPSS